MLFLCPGDLAPGLFRNFNATIGLHAQTCYLDLHRQSSMHLEFDIAEIDAWKFRCDTPSSGDRKDETLNHGCELTSATLDPKITAHPWPRTWDYLIYSQNLKKALSPSQLAAQWIYSDYTGVIFSSSQWPWPKRRLVRILASTEPVFQKIPRKAAGTPSLKSVQMKRYFLSMTWA